MHTIMSIPTLTAEPAAERLRPEGVKISADTIRQGIQQGAFPFGACVMDPKGRVRSCIIFDVQLEQWISERCAT